MSEKNLYFGELWEAPWSSFSICMYEAPLDELHESPWCFAKLFYGAFPGSFSRVLHESPGKIYKALFRVTSWGSCRVFSCEALLEVPHEEPGGFIKFRLRMLYEGPQECFMKQQGKKKVMNLVITFLMNIPHISKCISDRHWNGSITTQQDIHTWHRQKTIE